MSAALDSLARECQTFTHLIVRKAATPYVVSKYIDGHRVRPDLVPATPFEMRLIRIAANGPFRARLADAYARRVMPRSALRKKLVLLLAILETAPDLHRQVETPTDIGVLGALARLSWHGACGVALAAAALAMFGMVRLFSK
jgi:hypothetical protein